MVTEVEPGEPPSLKDLFFHTGEGRLLNKMTDLTYHSQGRQTPSHQGISLPEPEESRYQERKID